MDWGLYILFQVLGIGLGFLAYQDRLFGTAGMLLEFICGAFIYNDNGTTGITFNSTYSITGVAVIPYLLIVFVIFILDLAIVLTISANMKKTTFNSSES